MNICQECGGNTENGGSACKGSISQEYYLNAAFTGLDTKGMLTCNCCDDCRWQCHESFMDSIKDEN